MLRLRTLGGCLLERGGSRLDALSGQRKGLALLALLAATGERGLSRDAVLAYLWPDSDEERARTSLKQLVHSLRTQLRAADLLAPSAELRLNPIVVTSDVADFRAALARAVPEEAVALYAGPFLDGFYLRNADEFERWAATERAALAQDAARALEVLAERADARDDRRAAVEWWRRVAQAEPLSARAAIGLMRALDAIGERTAALQHARIYERLVQQEVGSAPDPSVTLLAEQLRRTAAPVGAPDLAATEHLAAIAGESSVGQAPAASGAAQTPVAERSRARPRTPLLFVAASLLVAVVLAGVGASWSRARSAAEGVAVDRGRAAATPVGVVRPSVAVLPFANTSGDPGDEPFSDGLTDELIGALGKVSGLKVAGRTSVFALEGKSLGVRAIADTLGVSTVLEGSVRRSGNRIKVTAQLVGATDNAVLWTETYDRERRDVFVVQEEIARAIVAALRVRLVDGGRGALVVRQTEDPRAYELYLRGRHLFNGRTTRDELLRASYYFAEAIARDSAYARAYAGLSDTHARLGIFGYGTSHEQFAKARTAARTALALDGTLAEAHASLAHVLCVYDFQWDAAEQEFRRAISLDPGYIFARLPFAICLASRGQYAEALAQLDTARAADPLSPAPSNLLGRVYVSAHRPDEAIRHLREALELNPQLDLAYQQLGHAYLQKGMHAEAIDALRRAAALSGPRDSAQLAYAYAVAGQRDEARRIVDRLVASSRPGDALPFHIAMAYVGLGDRDEAFRWLERGYAERSSFMGGLAATTAFAPLRTDPRWGPLLRRMRLDP